MIRTAMQIVIFISMCVLGTLCFLQGNKGQNVLNGFTNTGSNLFSQNKEVGSDRIITIVIYALIVVVFILSMVEISMG